jgi:peptidyl-prolyl cis-trans isomerase D
MISWIQRTFQHHFRLIFAVLLIGMVIPFIFTIGSTPGIGRADHTAVTRDFFGHNLLSEEERRVMLEDARMSAELQYGTADVSAEQIQYYMYQRVASLHLADQLRLPPPTTAETTEFIKHLRIFLGPDGQFDVNRYDAFRSSLKTGSGVTESDIARVIADDARINKVGHLLAGPGFATPADVNEIMNKGDTTWTVSTATADYATFAPGLTLTDTEIVKYFSDNSFRYTLPPRIGVDAIEFPAAAFAGGASPTDAEVREYYDENPGKFPKPAAAAKTPAAKPDPAADYAAVQPLVRLALVAELEQRSAVKAASDLAFALYDGKVTRASLDSFLASRKLKARSVAPFTREAGPAELGASKDIAEAAFGLSADKFYSEGLPIPSGAVVLIFRESLPSREPALAEVRDKVRADATDNQRRIRFAEFGRTLKAGVERRLKSGEPFDRAALDAAGDVKVQVKAYPPFTLREQPKDVDPAVFQALDGLGKGSVSDMEATADKGVLVYAADKKLPAADESNPRYAQVRAQIAAGFASAAETSVTREFVDTELKRTDPGAK